MSSETPTRPFFTHLFIIRYFTSSSLLRVASSTLVSAKINARAAALVALVGGLWRRINSAEQS